MDRGMVIYVKGQEPMENHGEQTVLAGEGRRGRGDIGERPSQPYPETRR